MTMLQIMMTMMLHDDDDNGDGDDDDDDDDDDNDDNHDVAARLHHGGAVHGENRPVSKPSTIRRPTPGRFSSHDSVIRQPKGIM